jgi:serine/threonine protein kinase
MSRSGEEKTGGSEEGGWKHISFDDVELGDVIGGGGAGVIYMGWYQDKAVALKTLFDPRVDENLKQEYLDELLVMSKLKHSNIVSFMGACMESPKLFFMMELCEGSLYNLLHVERFDFSEKERMRIIVSSFINLLVMNA